MNDDYSGREFIAYKGVSVNYDRITDLLLKKRRPYPNNYTTGYQDHVVSVQIQDNVYLGKISNPICIEPELQIIEPPLKPREYYSSVSGYNQEEMNEFINPYARLYKISYIDEYSKIFHELCRGHSSDIFNKIGVSLHFCAAIYDHCQGLVAGLTIPDGEFNNLYFGYPKDEEIMYSNSIDVLKEFCDVVYEMESCTYMLNGEFYKMNGKKINKPNNKIVYKKEGQMNKNLVEEKDQIKINDEMKNNIFMEELNGLLVQIASESIRKKIEDNINNFLTSEVHKEKFDKFLSKELDNQSKKKILEIVKDTINEIGSKDDVKNSINDIFNKQFEEYSKKKSIPVINIIKLNDTEIGRTDGEFFHEKFEEILTDIQLDEPVMLIGPAGAGKNHAIKQISKALNLQMYYTNNASNEFKLTGFIDAGGNYRETEFYKAFKNGGIFFLDELDTSDPTALITINAALANGYMAFPHETIDRHKDFRMIGAANTWGKGGDLLYVGRNALDGATLDRFDSIFFDYDKQLEKALYPNEDVLEFMWAFRDSIENVKIKHIVSTRGIGKVYKKEINKIPVETILKSNVIKNLKQDDLTIILGDMKAMNNNNYYSTIKTLKLVK